MSEKATHPRSVRKHVLDLVKIKRRNKRINDDVINVKLGA